jgi:hypothetical protein
VVGVVFLEHLGFALGLLFGLGGVIALGADDRGSKDAGEGQQAGEENDF